MQCVAQWPWAAQHPHTGCQTCWVCLPSLAAQLIQRQSAESCSDDLLGSGLQQLPCSASRAPQTRKPTQSSSARHTTSPAACHDLP